MECHVDGAQINAGLLVTEPTVCAISEEGGAIAGPLSLHRGGGVPLCLALRVLPNVVDGALAAKPVEAVVVPITGSLETLGVGTAAERIVLTLLRLRERAGVIGSVTLIDGLEVLPSKLTPGEPLWRWKPPPGLEAGDVLVVRVGGAGASSVDVEVTVRVRDFPAVGAGELS